MARLGAAAERTPYQPVHRNYQGCRRDGGEKKKGEISGGGG
jgi:hypothetical protein